MATSTEASKAAKLVSEIAVDSSKADSAALAQPRKPKPKKKNKVIADSWEDEEISSDDESTATLPPPKNETTGTSAPPPTSSTPSYYYTAAQVSSHTTASWPAADSGGNAPSRRPEKTDAVARRLIAGALGVRVPKQTEEQKAYEKSLRESERKRKEDERAFQKRLEEEKEKAKKAIWED